MNNDKNYMIFALMGFVLFGGLAYVMGQATGETIMLSENEIDSRTLLTLSGSAERKVEPNLVIFNVGVETTNENAEISASENAEIMENIKQALIDNGILEDNIKTNYYYINQDWYYPKEDEPRIVRYRTTHSLSVETKQISEVGKIIDAVVKAGANQVGNVQFTLDDETMNEIKKELVTEAIQNSRDKADSMANDLNQKIVGVKSMSTSADYNVGYNYYNRLLEADMDTAAKVDTEIFMDDIEVSAYVSAEYYSE
jgi:uncharacterized protein